jgi:hypothetical protein
VASSGVSYGECFTQVSVTNVTPPSGVSNQTAPSSNNVITGLFAGINKETGIGLTTMWLLVMLFIGFAVFYYSRDWGFSASGGLVLFMEGLMLVIGGVLGFISTGIIIVMALLCIVVVGFWLRGIVVGG